MLRLISFRKEMLQYALLYSSIFQLLSATLITGLPQAAFAVPVESITVPPATILPGYQSGHKVVPPLPRPLTVSKASRSESEMSIGPDGRSYFVATPLSQVR